MKKLVLSTVAFLSVLVGFSQQDAQFSQNMFNRLDINPGYAGSNGGICGVLLYRQQWMGFDGAPKTALFSGDAAILAGKLGVGLTVFQDQLGAEKSFVGKLAAAYRMSLGAGNLGIGVELGALNKSFGADWISTTPYTQDKSIPDASTSKTTFDMGAGLYYSIPQRMYVGISAAHIPQSTVEDAVNSGNVQSTLTYGLARHYYVMAGYYWDIEPGKWQLQPSVFAKSDGASTQLDINALILYNNFIWAGVSYRMQDAIAPMLGFNFGGISQNLNGLKLGIAYDVTTSTLSDYSSGSFEVMLKYCTNVSSTPKIQKYGSVRFL